MTTEIDLYLEYANRDLRAAEANQGMNFLHIAVSRGYYAMFYAASALLLSRGFTSRKHSGILSAFGEQFVKTGEMDKEFSQMLHNAFDARLDSDYDVAFKVNESVAIKIVEDAKRFVEAAEQILRTEDRP